jgi:hypothetical protein
MLGFVKHKMQCLNTEQMKTNSSFEEITDFGAER